MSSPVIGAWHCGGIFWGVGSASLFFTLSTLLSHIRRKTNGDNPVNELVNFRIYEFHLVSADNKKMHWLNIRHPHCVCVPAPSLPCSFT